VTDDSLSIDDVCHAPGETKGCGPTVGLSDDAAFIAQKERGYNGNVDTLLRAPRT